jgi:hypothetical protein
MITPLLQVELYLSTLYHNYWHRWLSCDSAWFWKPNVMLFFSHHFSYIYDKGDGGDYNGNINNNNYGWSICDINNIDGKNTGYRMIIVVKVIVVVVVIIVME